jgi:hypothetical protein
MALHADALDGKIIPTYTTFPLDVVNDRELQGLNIIVQVLSTIDEKSQKNIVSYLLKRYAAEKV